MRRPAIALVALASFAQCARSHLAPPALFPMKTSWITAVPDAIDSPLGTDGVRVFAALRGGSVAALDLAGTIAWRREGPAGRLAARPGLLIVHEREGGVRSLEPDSGAVRWTAETPVGGAQPPTIDRDLVLVVGQGAAALETATGRVVWTASDGADAAAPAVASGGLLLVAETDGTLRCRDRATGRSLWAYHTSGALLAPPLVDASGRVLLGTTDGRFIALNLKGKQLWRWKVGADVGSQAIVINDRVLFASFEAVLYSLNVHNGSMGWRYSLSSRPLSGPVEVGDAVLVVCQDRDLMGFDGRLGLKLGSFTAPAEIGTPPIVVGDRAFLGLRDRSVIALKLDMSPSRAVATPSPGPNAPRRPQ